MAFSLGVGERLGNQPLVVGGDRRVVAAVEQQPRAGHVLVADRRHVLQRDLRRLPVGALAQAHAVAAAHRLAHVVRRTVQGRLQHDTHVVVALAQQVEDLDRVLREVRAFHVEAHEAGDGPSRSRGSRRRSPGRESREMRCPIEDILIEMLRSMPAGISCSSSIEACVARRAASRSLTSSPSLSKVARMPRACRRSPARTASCGVSPATKRRAKIVRGFIAASGLRGASPRGWPSPPTRCRRGRGSRRPRSCAGASLPSRGRRGSR